MEEPMKKTMAFFVLVSMCVMAFAAGAADGATSIGITKIVAHPALDAVEQGILDELAELGHVALRFDFQNANGDMNAAASIASKFKADRVDVAVGIATPTAMALANSIKNIPIVFTAVTDPVDAGLVGSLANGSGNVTGYSDMTPVREQIEMLVRLGGVKRIGHVYSSGEANAVTLAKQAEETCNDLGVEFVAATVTNSAEVRQAALSIINKVDAIYLSTDNTVVSAISALTSVASDAGVPIVSADPSSAEEFEILAAYGFDYYTMGRATGRLIDRILKGANPGDIPVQFLTDEDDLVLLVNLDIAKKLGITLDADVVASADKIVENGVLSDN